MGFSSICASQHFLYCFVDVKNKICSAGRKELEKILISHVLIRVLPEKQNQ